jgi:hypothetical protein
MRGGIFKNKLKKLKADGHIPKNKPLVETRGYNQNLLLREIIIAIP